MTTQPELPSSPDAEAAVLGAVLLNRDAIIPIAPWLKAEHFYMARNAEIFDAMLKLYERRTPPDTQTVADELGRRGRLDAVGGVLYLAQLVDQVPTSYHVEYYARIVERTGLLRRLIDAGGRVAAMGYDQTAELEDTLQRAAQVVTDVAQARVGREFVSVATIVDTLYEQFQALNEGRVATVGVPSGYRDLDALTGGFQRSDLIVLAARPSVGKSAFMMSIAYNVAYEHHMNVGVLSLEMSREQLVQRLIAMDSGVDTQRLRLGHVREHELERVIGAMGKVASLPIHIEDTAGINVLEAITKARRLQAWQGLDLLLVDYLQLMTASGRARDNRVQEVSEISRGLKLLARELNIPVIALSQLSRAVEGRTSKVPQLSDLRESGAIEQDSDVVIFLYREELYDPQTEKKGIAELHIAKHRNGPLGIVPMRFDPSTTRFHTMTYRAPDGY